MPTLKRDCPHCGSQSMTFTVPWSTSLPGQNKAYSAVGICGGCGYPVAMLIAHPVASTYPHLSGADIEQDRFGILRIWPQAPKPEIPRHMDSDLQKKLLEAEKSFNAHINTGAAGLYRSVVDITTKFQLREKGLPEGGTLDARLTRLSENHVIPRAVADWGHEVRVVGNEGLHEGPVVDRTDAEMIRNFALTYLRYAFELPGDIKERREIKPPA